MRIKERNIGNVIVVELRGKLMGGPETTAVHDKVKDIAKSSDNPQVVIDLAKVKWMNNLGLGALMGSLTTTRNAGGNLKLAGVSEKVKSLFRITKLITIFETFDSAEDAAASFHSKPEEVTRHEN